MHAGMCAHTNINIFMLEEVIIYKYIIYKNIIFDVYIFTQF